MRRLGTISGEGTARYDNKTTPVQYEISVYDDGALREAHGHIRAPFRQLFEIQSAGMAKLVLKDGSSLDFMVRRHGMPDDHAEILVSGPVPGF